MHIVYPLEPFWHKNAPQGIPERVAAQGSMTEYMQQTSKHCFQLQLLVQAFGKPRTSEAFLLALAKDQSVMIREVYLLCDAEVSMFARSLFPLNSLLGEGWRLQGLGEQPLGPLLFSDPTLRRSPFDFAKLYSGDEDYDKATHRLEKKPAFLWARRSVFRWKEKDLMVQEVFLPSKIFESVL